MSPQEIDDSPTIKDCSFVARREAQIELQVLYPGHGGRDPVGAATAAQAAHEAEMETLRAALWRMQECAADADSLGRLYRAMHRIGELENENQALRASLEELVNKRDESWGNPRPMSQEWRDGSDGRYARARKALGRP